mmetsp:Transcript_58560/g.169915  ORF Transcript_58560/g.169915 Transcript_58560/m.169915 type:complete len:208 (-) Transcript_58560:209-832(-)
MGLTGPPAADVGARLVGLTPPPPLLAPRPRPPPEERPALDWLPRKEPRGETRERGLEFGDAGWCDGEAMRTERGRDTPPSAGITSWLAQLVLGCMKCSPATSLKGPLCLRPGDSSRMISSGRMANLPAKFSAGVAPSFRPSFSDMSPRTIRGGARGDGCGMPVALRPSEEPPRFADFAATRPDANQVGKSGAVEKGTSGRSLSDGSC